MAEVLNRKPLWRTVWFAVLICGTLLSLSLVPAIGQWIEVVDQRAAIWFNSHAGISPVFDRLVLLISDEEGTEILVVLASIWFLTTLWMSPTRVEKSRLLGTLLFVIMVLVFYFLIDALLDDVIQRKSPSVEFLKPFKDIGKILDYNVDLTNRRSFPNTEAMIFFTIGFLLLRLGRVRGGLVAMAIGATTPLLLCVAGLTWVSDIFLGALPLSVLISAMALETPFSRGLESFINFSAAGMDQVERMIRNFLPILRHRRLYWLSQKASHMEVAVKRFTTLELPRILDHENRHADQKPTLMVPLGGLRSVIRIAGIGPLKAVIRAYPLNQRLDAQQHFSASTLLKKHGVRVPSIYHRIENPKKYGALFIVEEFIDGHSKMPSEITEGDLVATAVELARLHQVKSPTWGPILQPRTEDYVTVLLRRLERQLVHIGNGPIISGQRIHVAEIRAWFNSWRDDLASVRDFSMIHAKLHRENCMFENNGGLCLLDVTTLEWGIPSVDLVMVYHSHCGGNPDLIQKFNAAYFPRVSESDAEKTRHFMPLFEAMYCLGQVSKHRKRLGRSHKSVTGDNITKGVRWWQRLLSIVHANESDR